MVYAHNPFSGIESPFFWPVGLALSMQKEALHQADKNLRFLNEIVTTDIIRPKPHWASANEIVYRVRTFTLRDFSPVKISSDDIPTLVLPPYAGHTSIIADFHAGQSMIETLITNGIKRIFAIEWHSATPDMKDLDIDDYLAELHVAIGDLGGRVNLIGICQGGWIAAIYAARFPSQVASIVCAGAPLDTQAGNGQIRDLANDLPMSFYESLVRAGDGLLKGEFMLEGFKNMHPDRQRVEKYVTLYEHIDDPDFVRRNEVFESWYENTVNLPGRWYLQAVNDLFKENLFAKGQFVALGQIVKPQTITCPVYLLAGTTDDITPVDQVFNASSFFGTPPGDIIKELATGGHIGLFMGSHALKESWPKIAAWLIKRK